MSGVKITGVFLLFHAVLILQAQIFSPEQVIANGNNPQVVKSADFNSDGCDDLVYSSISDHKIAVALYNPETGNFDEEQIVSNEFNYAVSLFPAELDGDGLTDLLTVSQLDHKVAWFKNDGNGNFSLQPLISSNAQGAVSVIAADIDGDGDQDVIAASKNENTIQWYENTDGNGTFSSPHLITTTGEYPVVVISADIDNDSDADIVAGMLASSEILWYPNDGTGNFGDAQLISSEINFISSLCAADLNGDNNVDIISASRNDNKIAWYENLDGAGSFSSQNIISGDFTMAFDVVAADFDLDNDMDLVASAMAANLIMVFNNSDGAGSFVEAQIISKVGEAPKGITTGDFDDDGDVDVAAALSQQDPDEVAWYENGAATFVVHTINKIRDVTEIALEDINNDGNVDIFYSDGQVVCWIENLGSAQSFGSETVLWQGYNIFELLFNDIDKDGDQDLFIADAMGDKVLWLENTDGNGTFSGEIVIDQTGDGPADIDFADVDGDSDDDLLVFFVNDNTVAVFENTDGQGTFLKSVIASVAQTSGCFMDADQDGDDDIVFSAYDEIRLMENDGAGNFSSSQPISGYGYAWKILPAMMNNDDFPDLVYSPDYILHWLENNQNMTFADYQVDMWGSVMDFTISDLDNDDDPDVLSACRTVGLVNFAENINHGDSLQITLPFLVHEANAVMTADLNNDGWNDAVVGSWPAEALYWAENYQYRILNHPVDQYVCEGDNAYFSVVSAGVNIYQWQVNSGSGFEDIADDDIYSGTEKAQLCIHNVTAEMFGNNYRCKVYDKRGVELITETAVLCDDCTAIPEQAASLPEIILYPNPTTGMITLPDDVKKSHLVIRDISGKTIDCCYKTENNQLDISGLENGIYLFGFYTKNGLVTRKVVKN